MPSYKYRKSHCGDKMVVRSSYLHNGIYYSCTGKMASLYSISPLQGAISIHVYRCHFTSRGIPAIKIRRSNNCLIFIMGNPIPGKRVFISKWDTCQHLLTLVMLHIFLFRKYVKNLCIFHAFSTLRWHR